MIKNIITVTYFNGATERFEFFNIKDYSEKIEKLAFKKLCKTIKDYDTNIEIIRN